MATIKATTLNKRVYQGEGGNVSKEGFTYTFAGQAIGTIVQGLKFPAGTKVTGVEYVNAALGTGATMDVKIGDTTLVSALSVAAAGKGYIPVEDTLITADSILSLVAGGAAPTGKVTFRLVYESLGTL